MHPTPRGAPFGADARNSICGEKYRQIMRFLFTGEIPEINPMLKDALDSGDEETIAFWDGREAVTQGLEEARQEYERIWKRIEIVNLNPSPIHGSVGEAKEKAG